MIKGFISISKQANTYHIIYIHIYVHDVHTLSTTIKTHILHDSLGQHKKLTLPIHIIAPKLTRD